MPSEMKYYVYVLKSTVNERIYIGMAIDVEKRLKEHNAGKTSSTKAFRPYKLVLAEKFNSRIEARQREKYLKTGSARERLKTKLLS